MADHPVRLLRCLYGTETGTAKEMAERLAMRARGRGMPECDVLAVDDVPLEELATAGPSVVHLFVVATTGQGDTPRSMQKTWDALLDPDQACDMNEMRFAVFGLGDSTYQHFNFAAKRLHNRLIQLGGKAIVNRGLGDEQDSKGFDEELEPWLVGFWAAIGLAQQQERFWFAPKFTVTSIGDTPFEGSAPRAVAGPRGRWQLPVTSVVRLTSTEHFQNVAQVTWARPPDLEFVPGDALGVWPKNSDEAVRTLADAYRNPTIIVNANAATFRRQNAEPFLGLAMPLAQLLSQYFDLDATARRPLFEAMAQVATDADDIERLQEIARLVPEYDRYCWREKRAPLEILNDFAPRIRMPLESLLSTLPRLLPRYYSISSPPSSTQVIDLTIALLDFKTPMGRRRTGFCSRQLTDPVCEGQVFDCELRIGAGATSALLESPHVIAVGPGTGIAPCRCVALSMPQRVTLFTGNRDRGKDFLHGADFAAAQVEVYSAFSRESPPHTWRYVQHALVANAARVAELLKAGACVFVSGNAKRMPQDVEESIRSIIENRICDGDRAKTDRFLKAMKLEGRYINDTWS